MADGRDPIVVLGEVSGAYGVHGSLRIRPYTQVPEALVGFANWWLRPRGEGWRQVARRAVKMHSGALVVELEGVASREAAQALKGSEIGVARAELPAAAANEIYLEDLIGLAVVNREGVALGEVRGVTEHGAHPLLQVARPSGTTGPERLIPYVPAIVDRVDLGAGRIEVDWGADY